MSTELSTLESRQHFLRATIAVYETELNAVECRIRDIKSREFIAANKITRDDVHLTTETGWTQDIGTLAARLRRMSNIKRFAEFNGWLWCAQFLASTGLEPTPAMLDHVPEKAT